MRVLALLAAGLFVVPVASAHITSDEHEAPPPLGPVELYHLYVMIGQELERLHELRPDLMEYKVIGKSVLGLDIYGVEVTNFQGGDVPMDDRYRLYFDGSIHSNEQLGMEAAMDILRWLIEDYDSDELAKWSVDNRRTFIVPLVNPDGNIRDSRRNANDVDLNRNFPAGWGGPGSSARGPAPLSEPETQAVAAYLEEVVPHYSNSFHTGTLMLLHPWGNYTRDTNVTSPDHDMYTAICQAIQAEMDAAAGREVPCGQVFSTIYPASGTTVDYVYDRFGSVSWTFEVDNEQNLWWSTEPIRQRLGETWASVTHAYENVHRYGGMLELLQVVPIVDDGVLTGFDVTVRNDGMGAASQIELRVGDETVEVPLLGANDTQTFRVPADWRPGDNGTLAIAYNKTFHKGFREVHGHAMSLQEADAGLVLVVEGLGAEAVDAVDAAKAPMIGLAWLLAALVLVRRRR